MTKKSDKAFRTVDVQHELQIKAPPARVWKALTEEIQAWWPAKFYVGSAPLRFTLEPKVGGRVYEDWGGGGDEGALWSTVTAVRVNELLQWSADLPPDYGGPARSITSFRLKGAGDATRLHFRDTLFGELSAEIGGQLEQGWGFLLAHCFQPYVEEGKRPERPQSVVAREGGARGSKSRGK